MAEMLSYLAAVLPYGVSAGARLVALQCALRMDSLMRVRLPVGVLRSLRLSTPQPWRELDQARWLRMLPSQRPGDVMAELQDPALLGQSPSLPDRKRAADWALRAGCRARTADADAHLQLLSVHIAAHSDPAIGRGQGEVDRMAHECGVEEQGVFEAFDRLVSIGSLEQWQLCPNTGDLRWSCIPHPRMAAQIRADSPDSGQGLRGSAQSAAAPDSPVR
ncbi:hypothetical protein [Streptomyces sp. NPDC004721]